MVLKPNKKRLSQWYVYDWHYGPPTGFVLRGRSVDNYTANYISKEMNIIVKHIWGVGYLGNTIFTSGLAPIFQSNDIKLNILRGRLVTRIWRYCKKKEIKINYSNFPSQPKHKIRNNPLNDFIYDMDKDNLLLGKN